MQLETGVHYTHFIRAFSAVVGVGAAIAYYFSQVKQDPLGSIILSESLYTLFLILFMITVYMRFNNEIQTEK